MKNLNLFDLACLSRKTNFYQCYRLIKIECADEMKIKMKWKKIQSVIGQRQTIVHRSEDIV